MLLQEGLSRLKIIDKQLSKLGDEIENYSAWNNRKNHPLGKVGTDEFSKKEAEKKIKSKFQKYRDLMNRYVELKLAIQKTNLKTTVEVGNKKLSIAEILILKNQGLEYQSNLVNSIDRAKNMAEMEVERFNNSLPSDALEENKADVWYLVETKEVNNIRKFINQFTEEIDSQLQILNATTEIKGLDN